MKSVLSIALLLHTTNALLVPTTKFAARCHKPRAPRVLFAESAAVQLPEPAAVSQAEDLMANAPSLIPGMTPLSPSAAIKNVLSGFTVSLAMIPEAVAFAFVAGVSPIVGLQTAAVMGFFAATFGGRGGIVTGASGACAVVVVALVASHGLPYLSACVLLAGLLQCLAGVMGWGKFIRLVPHPVMLGFVNGLAIVMTRAQLTHFAAPLAAGLLSAQSLTMFGLTLLTMVLVKLVPKITKVVPPSLAAVGLVTTLSNVLKLPATTLVDIAGKEAFAGGLAVLPSFGLPALAQMTAAPLSTLGIIFPYAATMATVGLVESLLTLQLVDGLVDDGTRGSTRFECIGQGLGNTFSGLTGGMGGCALIGQSLINVQSGGTSRLSGMSMALFLGTGLICAAPLLGQVPIAALVGVMLLVCHSTFSWSSLRLAGRIPKTDLACIVIVSLVTVFRDLAQAVGIGTIVSALSFAWRQSTKIKARVVDGAVKDASYEAECSVDDNDCKGVPTFQRRGWRTYFVDGPLFFGSTQTFSGLFKPKSDPNDVVIDFMESRVMDHSALEAINSLAERYGALGKRVHLRHLSSDCAGLLERMCGEECPPYELIEADPETDPVYEVAEDYSKFGSVPKPKLPKSDGEYKAAQEIY